MADKEYFEWLGDPETAKIPGVTRELAGVRFPGPKHIGVTGDKDKIEFFTKSPHFRKSTKTEFELNGGQDPENAVENAEIGSQGGSDGVGTQGLGGNGASTPG